MFGNLSLDDSYKNSNEVTVDHPLFSISFFLCCLVTPSRVYKISFPTVFLLRCTSSMGSPKSNQMKWFFSGTWYLLQLITTKVTNLKTYYKHKIHLNILYYPAGSRGNLRDLEPTKSHINPQNRTKNRPKPQTLTPHLWKCVLKLEILQLVDFFFIISAAIYTLFH